MDYCVLCNEGFNDIENPPYPLQCSHILCQACCVILSHDGDIICPVDNQVHTENWQPLQESEEDLKEVDDKQIMCYLDKDIPAALFCIQCYLPLCQSCVNIPSLQYPDGHSNHTAIVLDRPDSEEDLDYMFRNYISYFENVMKRAQKYLNEAQKAKEAIGASEQGRVAELMQCGQSLDMIMHVRNMCEGLQRELHVCVFSLTELLKFKPDIKRIKRKYNASPFCQKGFFFSALKQYASISIDDNSIQQLIRTTFDTMEQGGVPYIDPSKLQFYAIYTIKPPNQIIAFDLNTHLFIVYDMNAIFDENCSLCHLPNGSAMLTCFTDNQYNIATWSVGDQHLKIIKTVFGPKKLVYFDWKVFIIGLQVDSDCFEYDITHRTFTQIEQIPRQLQNPAIIAIKNQILVLGGKEQGEVSNQIISYDLNDKSWNVLDLYLDNPIYEFAVHRMSEKQILIFGGRNQEGKKQSQVYYIDMQSQSHIDTEDLIQEASFTQEAVKFQGSIFIFDTKLRLYIFDLLQMKWSIRNDCEVFTFLQQQRYSSLEVQKEEPEDTEEENQKKCCTCVLI